MRHTRYLHVCTGTVMTKADWLEHYDDEELAMRGVDAETAFDEDLDSQLFIDMDDMGEE